MRGAHDSSYYARKSSRTTLRALLVEDRPEDAEAFMTHLHAIREFSWDIVHIETLADACACVSRHPFDIVFLDLNLPDSSGANTVETFVSTAPTIPVIVLTAVRSRHLTSKVLQLGAEEYLLKDELTHIDLERAIRYAIDRKRAEQTLRESEERYRALVEQSPDAIVIHANGEIVFANQRAAEFAGVSSPRELLGRNPLDFIHPEEHHISIARIRHMLTTGEPVPPQHYRLVRADGRILHTEIVSSPLTWQGRSAIQVLIRDVSERVRQEKRWQALATLAEALRETTRIEDVCQQAITVICDQLNATSAAMLEYHSSGDFIISHAKGRWRPLRTRRISAQHELLQRTLQTRQAVTANNLSEFLARKKDVPYHHYLKEHQAIACVPLRSHLDTFGLIVIGTDTPFEEDDLALLTLLADFTASAYKRVQLHNETVRQLQRMTALRDIAVAMTGSLEMGLTANILLSKTTTLLQADAAALLVWDEERLTLSHLANYGFLFRDVEQAHVRLGQGLAGHVARTRKIVWSNTPLHDERATSVHRTLMAKEGFVLYHGAPLLARGVFKGVLEVYHRQIVPIDNEWLEMLHLITNQAAVAIDVLSLVEESRRAHLHLRIAYDETIEGWARALELRDHETEGHSRRVTEATLALARRLGIPDHDLVHMRRGALLHDIGKIGIPDAILNKPGPLTPEEWEIMRLHPVYAYNLLAPIEYLHPAIDIPYCHHEKWDGSGYPRGLRGHEIPLAARIFAIVDVWDALSHDRPYRRAWPRDKVINHLREQSGSHFDPDILPTFLLMLENGELAHLE
nr:HD domain-containing phosphohydrolase [Ardenticatena sp.]